MRRVLALIAIITFTATFTFTTNACKDSSTSSTVPSTTGNDTTGTGGNDHNGASEWTCGSYNGHTLYTGPKGGCYYYNSSGNKSYVDHKYCNC